MSCGRSRKGSRLSSRLTRTYALLFAATTLVLSLCVYLVSRRFLIGRRQAELVSASQNIAEIFCEELPDGGEGLADCRQADGRHLLMYRKNVLMPGDEAAVLAVVRSVDQEYAFLDMLAGLLLALNALGAAIALGVGRVMAARTLRPVSGMIARANALNAEALDTRLSAPEADDELRQLALTLNRMLDRVQDAFERQMHFAQDASHELRTPLSVLQGNAELLSRWAKDDPEARDVCVAAILRQTGYMNRLVENLLFLTRGDSGAQALHLQTVELAACLGEVAEERRFLDAAHVYAAGGGRPVPARGRDAAAPAAADPARQRRQVHARGRGNPPGKPPGRLLGRGERARPGLRRARGAARAHLRPLLSRRQGARETDGTGLGLAIARTIMRLHGGTISAQNAPDGGLIVTARFPAGRPCRQPPAAADSNTNPGAID